MTFLFAVVNYCFDFFAATILFGLRAVHSVSSSSYVGTVLYTLRRLCFCFL